MRFTNLPVCEHFDNMELKRLETSYSNGTQLRGANVKRFKRICRNLVIRACPTTKKYVDRVREKKMKAK